MAFNGFVFILATLLLPACATRIEIHDLKGRKLVAIEELMAQLPEKGNIVLGEYHYTPVIQEAEGQLINQIVKDKKAEGAFSVGWEFLSYNDQEKISAGMRKWQTGELTEQSFMNFVFSSKDIAEQHAPYLPLLRSIEKNRGELLGLNAPREWKKEILTKGLDQIDPALKPTKISLGSESYFERFKLPMKDHVKSDSTLERFFEAQYYTDSVMAWATETFASHPLRFLIAGSFHTDYQDGLVSELKQKSNLPVISVKLVDARKLEEKEIEKLLAPDEKYGEIADFVYLIR